MPPPTNWGISQGTTTNWDGSETDEGLSGSQVDSGYTTYNDYRIYNNKRIFFGDDDDYSIAFNTASSDLEVRDLGGEPIVSFNNITGFKPLVFTLDGGEY